MYKDGTMLTMSRIPELSECWPPGCPFSARGATGGPKNGSVIRYDGFIMADCFGIYIPLSLATSSLTYIIRARSFLINTTTMSTLTAAIHANPE